MKKFSELLTEAKIKQKPWDKNPKIGWWLDGKKITAYHGTHINNIDWVVQNGLKAPTEGYTAGIVSLALEPNTAWGYASMSGAGGEVESLRNVGADVKSTSHSERVVFILEFPKSYLLKNIMPITYRTSQDKLTKKELYDEWTRTDQEYYMMTELKFKGTVDPKYIKGYMKK
jgi:hypothetical protein